MKILLGAVFSIVLLPAFSTGPHMPLELSLKESQKLWKNYQAKEATRVLHEGDEKGEEIELTSVRQAIGNGERLLEWIEQINSTREEAKKIRLTSPQTRKGIPIDKPKKYGPSTIENDFQELRDAIPEQMRNVIYEKAPLPDNLAMSDEVFIEHGRKLSRLYQTAVRWHTIILPWKWYYKSKTVYDVRGFYHLNKWKDEGVLDDKLENYEGLKVTEQEKVKSYLVGLCHNSGQLLEPCERLFNNAAKKLGLVEFKDNHWGKGQAKWDGFYKITDPRTDIVWNSANPLEARIPFKDPKDARIAAFLKDNVEDEFKWEAWGLYIDFLTSTPVGTSKIEFKPGVTPHVSGGNKIVMDQNVDIEEYEVQWTIRHEFGHILRFPDCYVEFYLESEDVAVNYQLDTSDLMCSRAGDMNERIYQELRKVYFNDDTRT